MADFENKRRQKRISIELWIEARRGRELYFQRATNLSPGGAYFAQTFPLPKGTHVELRFTLPGDEQEISCRGEIVTTKELGMGVQFLALHDADRARIEALIDQAVVTEPGVAE